MDHRVPWPRTAEAGPRESLPQRTPGASATGWPEPASHGAGSREDQAPEFSFPDYIAAESPELAGERDFPPPPEVLDRVLDALRKLS